MLKVVAISRPSRKPPGHRLVHGGELFLVDEDPELAGVLEVGERAKKLAAAMRRSFFAAR